MEFYIDKNSSVPVAQQIQEQIKLAVMMGIFRKGDTLPSIRDIEKQTGINRSQIHKAYLALRKSGLLVLTRGKGSIVGAAPESTRGIDENCRKLSKAVISKVRRLGLSPTAFARYLSRHAREDERKSPLIFYVDSHEKLAAQTAEEISRLWQVPVAGLTLKDLKSTAKSGARKKFLVNHIMCDSVRARLPGRKSDIIPVELRAPDNVEEVFSKIKENSSVLIFHLPQPAHRLEFILARMRQDLEPRRVKISSRAVKNMSDMREALSSSDYDCYLVGPGLRAEVPPEMQQNPRIIQLHIQLDPASLEVARVKAGVII